MLQVVSHEAPEAPRIHILDGGCCNDGEQLGSVEERLDTAVGFIDGATVGKNEEPVGETLGIIAGSSILLHGQKRWNPD